MTRILLNDDIFGFDLDEALARLPEWRRRKSLAYRNERDRRLCAAVYELLRRGLGEMFGIEEPPSFCYMDGGKPVVAGHPEVHFSLSHCPVAALCAIGSSPVGADVERIRPFRKELAERVLSAAEMERVAGSLRPDVEFTRLWTMKESLLKLTGEGIRRELRTVLDDADARFSTTVCPDRGYVYTVCTRQ